MDNTVAIRAAGPVQEKRKQKYLHFKPRPEDTELLACLSAKQRALLQAEGSYKERAAKFGVAVGTIRSRLHRARAALAQLRAGRGSAAQAEMDVAPH